MPLPKQALLKRRRQILDDETADTHRFNAREYEDTWVHENNWVRNLTARLAELVRKTSCKN